MRRNNIMLLTDYGRTILIKPDIYTNNIPLAEWRYWVLKNKGNEYSVLKSIPSQWGVRFKL